jgi:hypothetical protein
VVGVSVAVVMVVIGSSSMSTTDIGLGGDARLLLRATAESTARLRTACGSGCDARRLSTGRSIRA